MYHMMFGFSQMLHAVSLTQYEKLSIGEKSSVQLAQPEWPKAMYTFTRSSLLNPDLFWSGHPDCAEADCNAPVTRSSYDRPAAHFRSLGYTLHAWEVNTSVSNQRRYRVSSISLACNLVLDEHTLRGQDHITGTAAHHVQQCSSHILDRLFGRHPLDSQLPLCSCGIESPPFSVRRPAGAAFKSLMFAR